MNHIAKQWRSSMDGMSAERTPRGCFPSSPRSRSSTTTATGCSGQGRQYLAGLLNEADGDATADGMPFDSLAGLALRRWCPPLLGLPPHASVDAYAERRAALGGEEVNRRFLGASGLAALCVDTGYAPAGLLTPGETAGSPGRRRSRSSALSRSRSRWRGRECAPPTSPTRTGRR